MELPPPWPFPSLLSLGGQGGGYPLEAHIYALYSLIPGILRHAQVHLSELLAKLSLTPVTNLLERAVTLDDIFILQAPGKMHIGNEIRQDEKRMTSDALFE